MLAVIAGVAAGATWSFFSKVELVEDNFDELIETTYICTGEVLRDCGPENAANELSAEGEDRVIVDYADMPAILIQAVVATEDKTFFDHRGIDPGGLIRAAYQVGKQKLTESEGSLQGGSTITQQYIKLATSDDADQVTRKAREMVRAIKLEQELAEQLGSTEAAKQQIIERYLNRAYFGRGGYGVQAASRVYFDKDVGELNLPEAAYLAGLLRNPSRGDAIDDLEEANRRRSVTLGLMVEQEYITAEQQLEAEADTWPNLIPKPVTEVGIGEVAGSEVGTEYFVSAVRRQIDDLFPNGQYFTQSLRVYTTLDPNLQRLAYDTITSRLDPNNPDMPLGSLVAVNDDGEVVAMMGGADWEKSQVNLAMGQRGGGSGFQAGSTMKTFALAEFIEQGFSPESFFEAPFTIEYPQDPEGKCAAWKVRGGVTNDPGRANHRTVYQATAGSINTVFAQIITEVGAEQVKDMATKLGVESEMLDCPSLVLGPNAVSPMEMAGAYANLLREGLRLDPVLIERIEDADGNVLCWYPTDTCDPASSQVRSGEQVLDPSVARQVNGALVGVIEGGTGRAARLILEDESLRKAAGKTGTTQNNRDAWFTGFTCGLTTSVWMGYPGVDGETPRYMNDAQNAENGVEIATIAELFGTDEYNNSRGNGDITGGEIPAEMWHDFMLAATAADPPCESLPTEGPSGDQRILGQDLLTTLVLCAEPDPALVAAQTTTTTMPAQPTPSDTEQPQETQPAAPTTAPSQDTQDTTPPDQSTPPSEEEAGGAPLGSDSASGVRTVAFRPAAAQTTQPPQPAPSAPAPTEPCIPIDLDGRPIESTTVSPAAPSTADPNGGGGDDENAANSNRGNNGNGNGGNNGNGNGNGGNNGNGNGGNNGNG